MKLLSSVLPYLLLVSFYTGQFNNFGTDKIKAINESPYHGVALSLIGAYDTGKYTEKDFEAAIKLFKKESKKHIWPWVFFNRFVGSAKPEDSHPSVSGSKPQKYFTDIKGMDIYNETGALDDFYNIWRISLRTAKEFGSPGIVVDAEAYNNYKCYRVSYLSDRLDKPEEEVKKRLREIGAELFEIADKEYPDATLWFLFTGLGDPVKTLNPLADKEYRTVTYIVQGMLERAKERKSKLKFVSGGELSLGYCYESLEDLQEKIKKRDETFSSVLSSYPNLQLGGTIAPWDKPESKTDWMLKGRCGKSRFKGIDDFKQSLNHLLKSYNYVWIYAASAAGYNPYNLDIYKIYNKSITEAINGER